MTTGYCISSEVHLNTSSVGHLFIGWEVLITHKMPFKTVIQHNSMWIPFRILLYVFHLILQSDSRQERGLPQRNNDGKFQEKRLYDTTYGFPCTQLARLWSISASRLYNGVSINSAGEGHTQLWSFVRKVNYEWTKILCIINLDEVRWKQPTYWTNWFGT